MHRSVIFIVSFVLLAGAAYAGPGAYGGPGFADVDTSRIPMPASKREEAHPKTYYDERKRGWWWYEPVPEKKKEEEPAKEKVTAPRPIPQLSDYTKEELWNMHPDDFKPLWYAFLKKAVQSPTVQNVREFYQLLDVARQKANAFSNVAGTVWQMHPELSLAKDFPVNGPGDAARTRIRLREIETRIREAQSDFGLIYFYGNGCEFCEAQDGILAFFLKKYGWEISRVEISEHPDLAARFEVQTVPFIMLIQRGNPEYIPVSAGVASLQEIEEKLFRGIRLLAGEITPEEYALYEFQRGGGFDPSAYTGARNSQ